MKVENFVYWRQGLKVEPEHFDQERRFLLSQLHTHFAGVPFSYGVIELEIDRDRLREGVFSLNKFTGIFKDRTIVRVIGLVGKIPVTDSDVLDVYLGIPEQGTDRFKEEVVEISREKKLITKTPNVKLLFGKEGVEEHDRFQIAIIKRGADRRWQLDENCVPARLNLSIAEEAKRRVEDSIFIANRLEALLSQVITSIGEALNDLAPQRRSRGDFLYHFDAEDHALLWFLTTVNRALPALKHFAKHPEQTHPERLFVALSEFAGELSTYSKEIEIHQLPDYDHDDLASTFSVFADSITRLLKSVQPSSRYREIPLVKETDPRRHVANIVARLPEWVGNQALFQFFLGVKGGDKDLTRFPQVVLIASFSEFSTGIPSGARITLREVQRNQFLNESDHTYYQLSPDAPTARTSWNNIANQSEPLVIFIPEGDFSNLPIKLISIRG